MDTSETYIKMCDFEEVQALSKCLSLKDQQGSTFVKADDHSLIIWAANMITTPPAVKFIRLFHQDQLQEILWSGYCDQNNIKGDITEMKITSLLSWLHDRERDFAIFPEFSNTEISMEQLWLRLLRFMLHNKVWNGEDWEII